MVDIQKVVMDEMLHDCLKDVQFYNAERILGLAPPTTETLISEQFVPETQSEATMSITYAKDVTLGRLMCDLGERLRNSGQPLTVQFLGWEHNTTPTWIAHMNARGYLVRAKATIWPAQQPAAISPTPQPAQQGRVYDTGQVELVF